MRSPSFAFVVLSLTAALAACGGAEARAKPTPEDAAKVQPATAANAPASADERVRRADMSRIKGDSAAKVWLVIVSDFQCPYCKVWHDSTGSTIEREYVATGKVRMAYVNFPLRMHQHSREASEGAMCAGAQGKFWEYGDKLFATQPEWSREATATPAFDAIGTGLGLDMTAWRACMTEHAMAGMIDADYDRGVKANVNSTPTFFVGDQVIEGAEGAAKFRAALDKALAGGK
ncbi:MAG: thioredoxin domain-containing protein [Gemmatimonadaceae bacterium]